MGGQKEMARTMIAQGADDVLALKDNQPTLHEEGPLFFAAVKAQRLAQVTSAHHQTIDAAHGRVETRDYWLTAAIEC